MYPVEALFTRIPFPSPWKLTLVTALFCYSGLYEYWMIKRRKYLKLMEKLRSAAKYDSKKVCRYHFNTWLVSAVQTKMTLFYIYILFIKSSISVVSSENEVVALRKITDLRTGKI